MLRWRMFGVGITLDWSWLLILVLITWSFADVAFPAAVPGRSTTAYVVMAVAGAALFFASVLVHELCHTLQSRREGVPIGQITLFLFGGVSQTEEPLPGPGAEFRVVAAGPASSAVLAVLFWLATVSGHVVGAPATVTAVVAYLAQLNLLLLGFNLLPALPLDGGRLLHAWLWRRSGDAQRATLAAAYGGRALGYLLVAAGLLSVWNSGSLAGVWLALIGWFVLASVQQEVRAARAQQAFTGLTVRDAMSAPPVWLEPDLSIAALADLLRDGMGHVPSHTVYPVAEHGRLVGLLVLGRAGRVPLERRSQVTVREVMEPSGALMTLSPDLDLTDAVTQLTREPGRAAVVGPEGTLVGMISASDVARVAEGPARPSPAGRP